MNIYEFMHARMQSIKLQLFPLFQYISLGSTSSIRIITLNCFNIKSTFILIVWKTCEKMKPTGSACWPSDLSSCQGHWKLYKMVQLKDACKHGRHEIKRLKSFCIMSNIKVFAKQDGWVDSQLQLTKIHVTEMDQKSIENFEKFAS